MNKAHLKRFVAIYANRVSTEKETEDGNHVLWMLKQLEPMIRQKGKINRWVGFIQGYCWANKLFCIDQMRWHIKDFSKPGVPIKCRHKVISLGPMTTMVHGSAPTDVCLDCGDYRITLHTVGRWQPGPVDTEPCDE